MSSANLDRKEQLRHRAISLRQHGFLVDYMSYKYTGLMGAVFGYTSFGYAYGQTVTCLQRYAEPIDTLFLCGN